MDQVTAARLAYLEAFDTPLLEPFGISEQMIARVLTAAVEKGEPVPPDYDWWASLPPDAVS